MARHPLYHNLSVLFLVNRIDTPVRAIALALGKLDMALHQGKEGMVFAHTNIFAGINFGATLAYNDVAGNDSFATEFLNAETFAD